MSQLPQSFDPQLIKGYHAHVYYRDDNERRIAGAIRDAVDERFDVELGRWRDEPVGPHPQPMYQIAFDTELFPTLVPWLQAVRGPLNILIHTSTGVSDLMDHTVGAMWLGSSLELIVEFFDRDGKSA